MEKEMKFKKAGWGARKSTSRKKKRAAAAPSRQRPAPNARMLGVALALLAEAFGGEEVVEPESAVFWARPAASEVSRCVFVSYLNVQKLKRSSTPRCPRTRCGCSSR